MKKRLFAIALALMLALSLGSTALAASPADMAVEEANLKLLAAGSYAMDMDLAMELSLAGWVINPDWVGETITMEMDCEADVLTDPDKMKLDMTITMETPFGKGTDRIPMYVVQEENSICVAMQADGEWEHIDLPLTDMLEGDLMGLDAMGSFTGVSGYYKSANANLNGSPAGRYTAKIRWDKYSEVFEKLDMAAAMGPMGTDAMLMAQAFGLSTEAMFAAFFEGVEPTEVHLYIDNETGLPVRYEADMARTMEQVLNNMFGMALDEMEAEPGALELSVHRYDLVMKIHDVGGVKDFKLPAGAKH